MPPTPWKPHPLLLATLVVVSLALRIPGMLDSLWFDEVWRTFVMLNHESIKDLLLHDVHNPLYNALMYGWIRLFGDSELSIRTPSLLAGYTMTFLVWRWSRDRFGPRVAFITLAWLLISPVPMWYSTEAKNSIFTVLTSALVLITHDRLMQSDPQRPRRLIACIAAVALAVLTDFQTLLIIIPVWAGIAIELARSRKNPGALAVPSPGRKLLLIMGASLLLLLPLLILKASNFSELHRDYVAIFNLKSLLWFLCLWMPIGTVLPNFPPGWWPAEVAITGIILLPLFYLGLRTLWKSPSGRMAARAFVFPLLFFLLAYLLLRAIGHHGRIYQDRNIIILVAWYPLVLAVGVDSIKLPRLRAAAALAVVGGALISSILICTILADRWTVLAPTPDWRAAAKIIDAWTPPKPGAADRPLVISRTALLPLKYYSHHSAICEFPKETTPTQAISSFLASSPGADEFFLISNPWWFGLKDDEMPEIDAQFPLIERINLRSLVLERRRRAPTPPTP